MSQKIPKDCNPNLNCSVTRVIRESKDGLALPIITADKSSKHIRNATLIYKNWYKKKELKAIQINPHHPIAGSHQPQVAI